MHQVSAKVRDCVELCIACYSAAALSSSECLERGGQYAESTHLRLLQDCSELCWLTADFLLRRSPQFGPVCDVCAEICDLTARSCEVFEDDSDMSDLARLCRDTAEFCREMSMPRAEAA